MCNGVTFAVIMVPLIRFIWALDTKKPELTGIKVTAGPGGRFLEFTGLVPITVRGWSMA